jgi:Tfp pilus assembly protein PilF
MMAYAPHQLAEAYLQAGEVSDALAVLDSHLAQSPDDETCHHLRAEIRLRVGDFSGAAEDFSRITNLQPESVILYSVALVNIGKTHDALHQLSLAYEADNRHEALVMRYVELLIAEGDISTARHIIHQQLTITTSPHYWHIRLGDVLVMNHQPAEAIPHYTRAIKALSPQADAGSHIGVMVGGWLCRRAAAFATYGDKNSALKDYASAQKLLPDDGMILVNMGLLMLSHNPTQALAYVQDAWARASVMMRQRIREVVPDEWLTILE